MMMEEVDLADTPLRPQLERQESEEPPDPRIQVELERLNTSTDLINKLEVDLDEGRMMFRQMLSESTQQINNLTKKLGKCIEQARPYYDARIKAKQSLTEAQKSAIRYERAVSQHSAAREMVQLAEEGLLTRGCIFDSTWQEMLNHATTKVNDAEKEKVESASEHKDRSYRYHESEGRVKVLQKELKRAITKSRPYFELKAAVNQRLEEKKRHVRELEDAVASAKTNYSEALANLERISDHIHKTRQTRLDLGVRGVGVGAESPGPPLSFEQIEERCNPSSQAVLTTDAENISMCCDESDHKNPEEEEGVRQRGGGDVAEPQREATLSHQGSLESGTFQNQTTDLSGWQFIGYSSGQNLLAVDDKESIVSDSESLTSMEMLSEEAIANLMLEDEIQEASHSIINSIESPLKNEPREPNLPAQDIPEKAIFPAYPNPPKEINAPAADSTSPLREQNTPTVLNKPKEFLSEAVAQNVNKGSSTINDTKRDSSSDSCSAWELVNSCSSNSNSSNKCSFEPKHEATSPVRPQTLPIEKCPNLTSSSSSLPSSSPSEHSSADVTPEYAPLCDTPETPHCAS